MWTYDDYLRQPEWFIKTLHLKWIIDNEVSKKQK
jgi:hypothetical protein